MKKYIIIILSVFLLVFAFYYLGKKFFPFNKLFGHRVIPANVLLTRTSANPNNNSLLCTFEIDEDKKIPPGFYKGIAHSGQFSAKAFGKNSYSPAIEQTAGQIGVGNLRNIVMSAWIFIFPTKNEPDGIYVLSVTNDYGISKAWRGIYMKGSNIPKGKWFRISGLFDLSDAILKPGYQVHIYFWNRSHTDILVDDYWIVFGGKPQERRGESTMVDVTKNPAFVPRFNFPPFQTFLAGKEEISNLNSACLVPDNSGKKGDIFPDDRILSGNFLQTGGTESILSIPSSGKPVLFSFCPASKSFTKITVTIPAEAALFFLSSKILKGRFSDKTYDQIGLAGDHEFIIGDFSPLKNICSAGNKVSSDFRMIRRSDMTLEGLEPMSKGVQILAGDLDSDGFTELLAVNVDGSWKIMKFLTGKGTKSGWTLTSSGSGKQSPFGNPGKEPVQITVGRFLANSPQDLILTTTSDKTGRRYISSLLKFDLKHSEFLPLDQNRFDGNLKIIGPDTLKPSDIFLFGDFRGNKKAGVLRYNRDWRFDLKEMNFNDTIFHILANIDFQGYEKDHNPKYYGILKICAGRFVDPDRTSLLLIGRNCKNWDNAANRCREYESLPELPDFISIYSLR